MKQIDRVMQAQMAKPLWCIQVVVAGSPEWKVTQAIAASAPAAPTANSKKKVTITFLGNGVLFWEGSEFRVPEFGRKCR